MITRKPKPKKCRFCGFLFEPWSSTQVVCDHSCAAAYGRKQTEKAIAKAAKIERAQDRAKRISMKKRSEWMSEAQDAFNLFIRLRDEGLPCICCGQFPDATDWKPGGVWDAGHFLSRGAYPELRFEETNCHRQLKTCNGGSGKYARKGRTVSQGYREGLIARIGLERVEELEGPHEPKHYTIDDLKAIKAHYTAKAKALRMLMAA